MTQSQIPKRFQIRRPDDFHVHFRSGALLRAVLPYTARVFGRAMVMPNLSPNPVLTADDVRRYYDEIMGVVSGLGLTHDFKPLMTIQIVDGTTPEVVEAAVRTGLVVAGKVYPKGVTTNSHNGVTDFNKLDAVFSMMEKCGMILSIHGQDPSSFCLDREVDFLPTLRKVALKFPGLRIVMEHLSTEAAVSMVRSLPENVAGTITPHHLSIDLHDVLCHRVSEGGVEREGIAPHHYCQPIPQRPTDRLALIQAALSGQRKFFLGSDSAPWLRGRKEAECGCAGIFNAPVVIPSLVQIFTSDPDLRDPIRQLEAFTSGFGAEFYGQPLNRDTITIVQDEWTVPEKIVEMDDLRPFFAGKPLQYRVDETIEV